MSQITLIGLLTLGPIISYFWSLFPISYFTPQLLAVLLIPAILSYTKNRLLFIILTSYIINLLVFTTGAAASPVFFLTYFLLFLLGFQLHFTTILSYSLILVLILSQSLNSITSFITLFSLVFVAPLIWFINQLKTTIQNEETDFHLWASLRLRSGLNRILDASRCLTTTNLNPDQKRLTKTVKDTSAYLLDSLDKLKKDL